MNSIEVESLAKTFKIPHERRGTLLENLVSTIKGQRSKFEEFKALKDINFTIKKGESVGIIGENGSGKSTLLKIIANILRPSEGSIRTHGKITSFLELGVGFQGDLTARDNIYLYGSIMGLTKKDIDKKLDNILEFSGLRKFLDTKLKNFSSGMQVRLAFATAIQTSPDILLVDEVLAVGDMDFQQKCFDVFNEFKKKGVTIIFVSHDLVSTRRFCDKALLLKNGRQIAFGKINEIIDKYVYSEESTRIPESISRKRKVTITEVDFLNKFNEKSNRFNTNDPFIIQINYLAKEKIEDPIFGIAIYSEKDDLIYGTNTYLKNIPIPFIDGKGKVILSFNSIPLQEGKFFVTIAVHTRDNKPYHWLDKKFNFSMIKTNENQGMIDMSCDWKIDV